MSEFKTPIKTKRGIDAGDKIEIPPSPFLNRLGYGTGGKILKFYFFLTELTRLLIIFELIIIFNPTF